MTNIETEKELEIALEDYAQKFGEPYIFQIGFHDATSEETITEIRQLIAKGKKQVKYRYAKDFDY